MVFTESEEWKVVKGAIMLLEMKGEDIYEFDSNWYVVLQEILPKYP